MNSVITKVVPRTSDIGNLKVKQAWPSIERRSVGPFVFWDQFGPSQLLAGIGLDVRPQPHIGLVSLSYLFEGQIQHRDSLGSSVICRLGAVSLMLAGAGAGAGGRGRAGFVHSERSDAFSHQPIGKLCGIQSWVALPTEMGGVFPGLFSF
jgi:redox-sensitive bicupin YhaK (pirin superfamily)